MPSISLPVQPEDWMPVVCPSCGGDHLHHDKVEVFERTADDVPEGLHVTLEGPTLQTDTDLTGNPSRRRNGIRVRFWCEDCPTLSALEILQHKGATYMWWAK